MDLYYNKEKISPIPVVSTTTIGELKQNIKDWLTPQGVIKYTVRIFFSDKSELSPEVLDTNSYDQITFESRSHLLNGSSVHVTYVVPVSQQPITNPGCQYIYQRGRDKGNRCNNKVIDDNETIGSDIYCNHCLRKKVVRRRLNIKTFYMGNEIIEIMLSSGLKNVRTGH